MPLILTQICLPPPGSPAPCHASQSFDWFLVFGAWRHSGPQPAPGHWDKFLVSHLHVLPHMLRLSYNIADTKLALWAW